ncbi:MAG: methyl-accepting chemotaxis protein [Desulfobulbaceae bacterium]|nr:MAG: methyl-accepting chemotaxis protein [Desulfobulbaceae bacterium]
MNKPYKRRNYFIKKDFQGKLILGYFLFVMGGCLLFIIMLGIISADTLTISYTDHDLQLGQTPMMLIKNVIAANWVLIVIGGTFLVLAAMLITHRIAGPLYRFEMALDNMVAGRLNDFIHLRENDNGKELAEKINTFNKKLSATIDTIDTNAALLASLLIQARTSGNPGSEDPELGEVYRRMEETTAHIRQACSAFTLGDE